MKVRVPYSLVEKFLNCEGLIIENDLVEVPGIGGIKSFVPGEQHYRFEIDVTDDPDHYSCVTEWTHVIDKYFRSSYNAYRIDIGPCKGIWPVALAEVNNRIIAHFRADDVNSNDRSWKDWFIREDIIIAPK